MRETIFEHLAAVAVLFLVLWSAVLLWASLVLRRALRMLIAERRELRRWKRLQGISKKQRQPWN
jgi:hypothetical protein